MTAKTPPSQAELEILEYLTAHPGSTVRDVADGFGEERGLARTTVLTANGDCDFAIPPELAATMVNVNLSDVDVAVAMNVIADGCGLGLHEERPRNGRVRYAVRAR